MLIRKAKPSDLDDLRELYFKHLKQDQEWPEREAMADSLQKLLRLPDYFLLVCDEDGKAVATVTLIVIPNLTHSMRPYAIIENVVTHEDYRGRGFASALMEEASRIASGYGCYKIMLMTGSKKESTLRFYERCGFNKNDKTAFVKWL